MGVAVFANLDIQEPRHSQGTLTVLVSTSSHLSLGQLQNWVNRGHFQLANQNPGTGNRRMYSIADMISVAVTAKMTDLGIAISAAAPIAQRATAEWCRERRNVVWQAEKYVRAVEADEPPPDLSKHSSYLRVWRAKSDDYRWRVERYDPLKALSREGNSGILINLSGTAREILVDLYYLQKREQAEKDQ